MGTVRLHPRRPGATPTISAFAHRLDAQRYVCPQPWSRLLGRLLDPTGSLVVLGVTGGVGAGKSAALREAARRAADAGCTVITLDGRRPDTADALSRLPDLPGGRTLIVVDEADQLGAGLHALGRTLADLPESARVVVAGRRLPARWLPDHLAPLAARHRAGPLSRAESEALLEGYDVEEPVVRDAIARWADGLPLALVLGAAAAGSATAADLPRLTAALAAGTEEELIDHIAGPALAQVDADLLAVAALAGGVDGRLLADALPDGDAASGLARLAACSFVDHVAGRLLLPPRLADIASARLRSADPARAEELTLRIAAHLRDRAVAGDRQALPWLAGLVRDPGLRAGLAPAVGAHFYADRLRSEDAALIRDRLDQQRPGVWALVEPWLGHESAHAVRRSDGAVVALVAALSLGSAGSLAGARADLVGPVVEHARGLGHTDRAVLTPFQLVLGDGDELDPEVVRIRNAVALQRCGVLNPRRDFVVELTGCEVERSVLAAYGYEEIPELAREVRGVGVHVWGADVGPGGIAGLLHDAVSAEQRQPSDLRPGPGVVLMQALDTFHSDAGLAALAVASADLPRERAAARVRGWVRESVDLLLADDPLLHDLVVRRFLQPGATHAAVIRDTFLSRATYFRRLARARAILSGDVPVAAARD